jgi:hypothetical protein
MFEHLDHLLLGVADLDYGIRWVEERTGVRPTVGGSHPAWGTRNALLSLGRRQYLEVIAPDPAPDPAQQAYTFYIDVRSLREPRLITWAAVTADIEAVARNAKAAGYDVLGPLDGSRVRPDGRVLAWRTLRGSSRMTTGVVDPVPFFIQWAADTAHPASDAPRGCDLKDVRIEHPAPVDVTTALAVLGIAADVSAAAEPAICATLSSPKGVVHVR